MPESIALKLPLLVAEQAQKHVTHNEALRALDAIVQLSVEDRDLATPPASPAEGDRYIVAASPTGIWAGHAADVAVWQDGAWDFHNPREGWQCWVEDENVLLIFNGSAWVDWGAALGALQNLSLLGIGTTADATNPFSAKLNKALWTAKYAAEGGDGDLRYTMNKETTADVVSILLQKAFSGRAEIGLIGDDDLLFKTSPDGSSFLEALRLDKTTAAAKFVGGHARVNQYGFGFDQDPTSTFRLALLLSGAGTFMGDTFPANSAAFIYKNSGLASFTLVGEGTGNHGFQAHQFVGGAGGPSVIFGKGRGTPDAPATAIQDDVMGTFFYTFHNGTTLLVAGAFRQKLIATTPNASARDSRFEILTGSGSSATAATASFDLTSGFALGAVTDIVIDQNRLLQNRTATLGTLHTGVAGKQEFPTDLGGGANLLVHDGSLWKRVGNGGQQSVATDAAFTLAVLTSAENQKHTGTLTANRTVTLSTAGAYAGARFRITRTGAGAFNLDFGGLKNLATNTWAEAVYDGSTWYLAAYGAL